MTVDDSSLTTHTSYRTLLGNHELVSMLAARAISATGDQVARVVLALVVLQRSDGGPFLSALVLAVGYLPATVGYALLGSLADRYPRRAVLLVSDASRALLIGVLAFLVPSGVDLWVILVVLLAAEMFIPPSAAASQSLLPDVSRSYVEYQQANGIKSTADQAVQVLGFVLGGLALQVSSAGWALGFDVATFAVAFVIVVLFVHRRPAPDEPGTSGRRLVSDVRIGIKILSSRRGLRWLALLAWTSAALLVATDGVALPYALSHGASDTVATALLAATPAGAAIAAFVVGRWAIARQLRALFPLAVCSTVPMVITGLDPALPVAWLLWFVTGLCQGYIVTVMTLVVVLTPEKQRGRVVGLVAGAFNFAAALTFLGVGLVTQAVTAAFALCLVGSLGLATLVLMWMMWPTRDVNGAVRGTYGATSRRT
jgi:MFS family permease